MQKEDNVAIKQRQNDAKKITITYRIHIHPYTNTLTKNSWEWRFKTETTTTKDWNPDSDVINLMDNYNYRTKKKKVFLKHVQKVNWYKSNNKLKSYFLTLEKQKVKG